VFPVPTAEEAAARLPHKGRDAEYGVADRPGPLPSEAKHIRYIGLDCPVCHTHWSATLDEVGHETVCPDCGTAVLVPPPEEPPPTRRAPDQIDPSEEYGLWGVGQPPQECKEVYQTYVPVICSRCRTRMLATLEQVGGSLVCPDCGTANVVAPPPEEPQESVAAHDTEDVYALGGTGRPSESAASQTYFPVICPLCHTRLHATLDQVGQQLICPDCSTPVPIPAPPPAPPKIDPMAGADQSYTVGEPIRPRQFEPIFECDWIETEPVESSRPEHGEPLRATLPASPTPAAFFAGIFRFPFSSGVLARWLALAIGATVVVWFVDAAIAFGQVETEISYFLSMGCGCVAGLLALLLAAIASASLLAIVVDTAAGSQEVVNWPEPIFLDWMFDAFYLLGALTVSLLPGLGLAWLLEKNGHAAGLSVPIGAFLLFPVVLLSMLEGGSVFRLFSKAVGRTLLSTWWAWVIFYLETAALLLASTSLAQASRLMLGGIGTPLAVIFLTTAVMIYFRLLGRLAWVGAGDLQIRR
jgi:DNA-directed RNA polymerase subunit RPC12/RpoP